MDDIYTAFPAEHQARIAQIDQIRAGAGDDVVDLTSQRYEYVGDGVIVRGGSGDDTSWANKGENKFFDDAGNDRLERSLRIRRKACWHDLIRRPNQQTGIVQKVHSPVFFISEPNSKVLPAALKRFPAFGKSAVSTVTAEGNFNLRLPTARRSFFKSAHH